MSRTSSKQSGEVQFHYIVDVNIDCSFVTLMDRACALDMTKL